MTTPVTWPRKMRSRRRARRGSWSERKERECAARRRARADLLVALAAAAMGLAAVVGAVLALAPR